MKKRKNRAGCSLTVIYIVCAVILIAFAIWFTYKVASSDLPQWLKFLILR